MTDSNSPAAKAPVQGWMILALVMAAFVGGAGTLWSGWLDDDIAVVRENPSLAGVGGATRAFATQDWPGPSEPGAWRPVTLASFALTHSISAEGVRGRQPGPDHVLNVLLHILACWLLFRVVLRLAPGTPLLAFGTAVVFAVHPLHIRTLAPLSGRADLLAMVFACATVLGWLAFRRGNRALLPVTVLAWFFALGSHEVALGIPLLLMALPSETKRPWLAFMAFVPALGLYLLGGGAPDGSIVGVRDHLVGGAAAFGRVVVQWLLPVRLPTERVEALVAPGQAGLIVAFVVFSVSLFFAVRAFMGRAGWITRAWCGACLLFAVPLLLHAGRAPLGFSLGYVVTAPLALVAGVAAVALSRSPALLTSSVAGLLAVASLAFLSVSETTHWRDDESRFNRRMALNADDFAGQVAFARFLRHEARSEQRRSIQLPSDHPESDRAIKRRKKLLARAREWSVRSTQGPGRRRSDTWRERGLVLAAQQEWGNALPILEHAAKLDPRLSDTDRMKVEVARGRMDDAAELFFAIGNAHQSLGRPENAAEPYRFASLLAPDNVEYLHRAGLAMTRAGRYREGLPMLKKALRETDDPVVRESLIAVIETEERAATRLSGRFLQEGRLAQQEGSYRQAVKAFERALRVNDTLVEAHLQVGYLRGWHFGNYKLGYRHLDTAERILRGRDPAHPQIAEVEKYRKSLRKLEREEPPQDNNKLEPEEPPQKNK